MTTQTLSKMGKKPSQIVSELANDESTEKILNELNNSVPKTEEEETTEEGQTTGSKLLSGITKAEGLIGDATPILGAITEQYGMTKAYNKGLESEAKKHKNKMILRDNANII